MKICMLRDFKNVPANDRQLREYCGEAHSPKWNTIRFSNGPGRQPEDRPAREFTRAQEDELRDFLVDGNATKYKGVMVWIDGKAMPLKAILLPFGNGVALTLIESGFHVIVESPALV